jgi:hypothetical protein
MKLLVIRQEKSVLRELNVVLQWVQSTVIS